MIREWCSTVLAGVVAAEMGIKGMRLEGDIMLVVEVVVMQGARIWGA